MSISNVLLIGWPSVVEFLVGFVNSYPVAVFAHSVPHHLCCTDLGFLFLGRRHILRNAFLFIFLFFYEYRHDLHKVQLELVRIPLLLLLQLLYRHHVFVKTVVHLLGEHELFFVELEEYL